MGQQVILYRISGIILFLWLVMGTTMAQAQRETSMSKQHLFKSSITIAPGTNDDIFLNGYSEYFPENKVGIQGNLLIDVASPNQKHMLLFGTNYHFFEDKLVDPFIGIQPGLSLYNVSPCPPGQNCTREIHSVAPVVGISAGSNYYVGQYMHFFAYGTYVIGNSFSFIDSRKANLNQVLVSAGLGFNIRLKKLN